MPPETFSDHQEGVLEEWNDERGFGFIQPVAGGPRAFAHVSAFPRGRRPVAGSRVAYAMARDERGRTQAADVRFLTAGATDQVPAGVVRALAVALTFFVVLLILLMLEHIPVLLPLVYAVLSALAGVLYRADKTAAVKGSWRISESTLLVVALLGGWPGALVARHVLRHKTTKQPFRTLFWGAVVINCLMLAGYVYAGADIAAGFLDSRV